MRSALLNFHLRWLRSILLLLVSSLLICSPQVTRHVYASDITPRLFLPTIYHPDVTRIAFQTLSALTGAPDSQINVIPAIGGTPITLPNGCGGFATHPSWSPDATEIAFIFGSRTNPTAGGVCIA